jgi:serine protease Do
MSKLIHFFLLNFLLLIPKSYAIPENFADLVEGLMPSVVNISTTQKTSPYAGGLRPFENFPHGDEFSDFLEKFGLLPPGGLQNDRVGKKKEIPLGSGFIIDAEGYIATNNHVIVDAEEIIVHLSDDKEYKATLVGFDAKTDLALLKIQTGKSLPFVKFGDSETARVGEWVIAIGNQLGFGGTVTAGIISSKSRDINADGIVDNFIQTDVAINGGSSGGPMFNTKGEVIGINTAIVSPSRGNIGIGFATPVSLARPILEQLRNTGKVQRAYIGVKIQQIDDEMAESLGIDSNKGVLIAEVIKNGSADKAGLKAGDIMLSFDGKIINSKNKLPRIVAETDLKKTVEVVYLRKNEQKTTKLVITELKENSDDSDEADIILDSPNVSKDLYGLLLSKITKDLRNKYEISPEINGCIIVKIAPKGLWTRRGLQKGDVIIEANQEQVENPDALEGIIKKAIKQRRKSIFLLVSRSSQLIFITLPIIER